MSARNKEADFSEDLFSDTRMSFGDHIEALRTHMWRAILGFVVALLFSLLLGKPLVQFIALPVDNALEKYYARRVEEVKRQLESGSSDNLERVNAAKDMDVMVNRKRLAEALGLPAPAPDQPEYVEVPMRIKPVDVAVTLAEAQRKVVRPATLSTLTVTEAFIVYFKVSVYCGIVLASPWIFYQLWMFVAAGLYPHERRYVNIYLPFSLCLFLAGVFLCEFLVLPKAVDYLLSFNDWMGVEPNLRLNDWLTFAIITPLMFGVSFQTPLIMLFLNRLGLMSVETYTRHRRIALFALACVAVILSASPDAISYLSLVIPMWGLYEFGILLCRFMPRPQPAGDVPEEDEMVEV